MKKILIIALSGIGDALMFTPSIELLRKLLPDAKIEALTMFTGAKEMYERNPYIDQVHYFDFLNSPKFSSLKFIMGLRGKYDATINVYPSNRKEYNLISFLLGAKSRCAATYIRKDFQNLGFLNNIRINEIDTQHNVRTNIKIIEKLLKINIDEEPDLLFPLTEQDENAASNYFNEINLKEKDLVIGIHPGSATLKNHINRRWAPEKFAKLAKRLISDFGATIFIFGGPDENELKDSVKNMIGHSSAHIINTKTFPQNAAIAKRCDVFVTNDSSMMHVASALKKNVAALIGPTNADYIHPWKTNYKIISLNLDCSPCFFYSPRPLICTRNDTKYKCIKEIEVDTVYNAVKGFINEIKK